MECDYICWLDCINTYNRIYSSSFDHGSLGCRDDIDVFMQLLSCPHYVGCYYYRMYEQALTVAILQVPAYFWALQKEVYCKHVRLFLSYGV